MAVTLPAAAIVGAILGVMVGLPALRLKGLYLAVSTLAVTVHRGPSAASNGQSAGNPITCSLGSVPRYTSIESTLTSAQTQSMTWLTDTSPTLFATATQSYIDYANLFTTSAPVY